MTVQEITISTPWAITTAILCGLTCLIHTFIGTREVSPSLRSLEEGPRLTLTYAWHAVSLVLLTMTLGYVAPLFIPGTEAVFAFAQALTLLMCVLGFAMNAVVRPSSWTVLPQGFLFAGIFVCGTIALL